MASHARGRRVRVWFGFHEVFHAATILAYLTQYAAVSLVIYRVT